MNCGIEIATRKRLLSGTAPGEPSCRISFIFSIRRHRGPAPARPGPPASMLASGRYALRVPMARLATMRREDTQMIYEVLYQTIDPARRDEYVNVFREAFRAANFAG